RRSGGRGPGAGRMGRGDRPGGVAGSRAVRADLPVDPTALLGAVHALRARLRRGRGSDASGGGGQGRHNAPDRAVRMAGRRHVPRPDPSGAPGLAVLRLGGGPGQRVRGPSPRPPAQGDRRFGHDPVPLLEHLSGVAVVRFRHRPGRPIPTQIHGNKRLELAWTIAPALLLAGISIPTIGTIFSVARKPANALQITVTGHQWWWQVQYPTYGFTTANEIHIPAGKPVYVTLKAYDVIHSFWIPRLAGTQDLEPGRVNHITIEADAPGRFFGQCNEYCGISHAN